MADIDQDSHNEASGGFHGYYFSELVNAANALPTDNSLLTFDVTFKLDTSTTFASYQSIDIL